MQTALLDTRDLPESPGDSVTAAPEPTVIDRAKALLRDPRGLAAFLTLVMTSPAFAQSAGGNGSVVTFLTNISNLITGQVGQGIAVIAIAIVGITWCLGGVSMRAFGGVIGGIILLFSCAWVLTQIVGGGTTSL